MENDLKTKAEQYKAELQLATRHAKQLMELDAEARARVRKCIDDLVGGTDKKGESKP